MKLDFLKQIYKKLLGYFLLLLFCGYFSSVTFFPHSHIVDGVTVVHSHPYKSHPGNNPVNHNHSKEELIFIQFISHFKAIAPLIFFGVAIFWKILNARVLITETNLYFSLHHYSPFLPRAPTS
jgi:hypothetical protein